MTLPSGPLGSRPDIALGLARAMDTEKHLPHDGPPEPGRSGGGCRRPLVIAGRLLLLFVLFGWAMTLITKFTQS